MNFAFGGRPIWLTCDFIERSFVRLALAETLFDRAEAEYKGDAPADPTQAVLPVVANEKPEDWPSRASNSLPTDCVRRKPTCRYSVYSRVSARMPSAF